MSGRKILLALLACALLWAGTGRAEEGLRGYEKENGYVYVSLGRYPQLADGTEQPIVWRVLTADGEKAYLLSEYILFARPMHITRQDVGTEKRQKENRTRAEYRDELKGDFAGTELCEYLNGTFAERAFTPEERELLLPCGDYGKVFLVSLEDMKNRDIGLGTTHKGTNNLKKIAEDPGVRAWGTEWAIHDNGVPQAEYPNPRERVYGLAGERVTVEETRLYVFQAKYGSCSPWWARSQSSSDGRHAVATKDGGQIGHIDVARDNIGVRPALYLSMDRMEIAGGAGTLEDPYRIGEKTEERNR